MKLTVNGSWTQYMEPLRELEPFTTHGSLHGEPYPLGTGYVSTGELPDDWARLFVARSHIIDYVAFSYHTPIAWHDRETGWVCPEERYSVSTSKQQGRIFTAISQL